MTMVITQDTKNAMQSGRRLQKLWVLKEASPRPYTKDPLMGWTGTLSTAYQVNMHFKTLEEAEAYAKSQGMTYEVVHSDEAAFQPKPYGTHFSATHIRTRGVPLLVRDLGRKTSKA